MANQNTTPQPPIHIALNIDHQYVKFCVVMLRSAFINNAPGSLVVHIIADNLTDDDHKIILDETAGFSNSVLFHAVSKELVSSLPIDDLSHISLSTYYRLYLPQILPDNIHRVIYLDCDLVVRHSLLPLWQEDISGYAVGVVEDFLCDYDDPEGRLGYDRSYSYFNAGVLLVNLDYWREHNVTEQCLDFLAATPAEKIVYYDQDVLNAVLHTSRKWLPFTWNMQEGFYRRRRSIRPERWSEIDRDITDPAILHFLGKKKPWLPKCDHPLRGEWHKYVDSTLRWRGERPHEGLGLKMRRAYHAALSALCIRKSTFKPLKEYK